MAKPKKERPLTTAERAKIWNAIRRHQTPDDREPDEVIKEDYKGDEERYLKLMAKCYKIPLSEKKK